MVAKEGPVLIVKPDGRVVRGTAGIDMLDEATYVVSNVIEGAWPAKAVWIHSGTAANVCCRSTPEEI
jgi:hypothetical protein